MRTEKSLRLTVAFLLASVCGGALAAQEPRAPWLDLDLFVAEPRIREVILSPAGDRLAYLLREDHSASVWTLEAANGERRKRCDVKLVESLHFSTDGEGIFLETSEKIAYMPVEEGRPSLIAKLDPLREQRFLGVDPVLPRHVLVSDKEDEGKYRLLRIDSRGETEVVYENDVAVLSFLLDDAGRVAFLNGPDGLEQVVYQVDGDARRKVLRCNALDACTPLATDSGGRRLLVRGHVGGDLWRLVAVDLETGSLETVHRDPEGLADLASVLIDPVRRTPLLANYDTDRRRVYALDPETGRHLSRIRERFPGRDLRIDARLEGRYYLITESGARLQHARYHLYDTERHRIEPVLEDERRKVDVLPEEALVEKRHVRYRASDGRLLYGFLSVPRGVNLASAPVVVQVHGGPWNHVDSGFHPVFQFLANRGYVVFQPNFRGSTGYGLAYLRAAQGDFGDGRVHQDVIDGLDYVLSEGIGDPARVAILGHSFGGFSALGGVAFSPERFRAGVASAPPIDLVRAVRDLDDYETLPNGVPRKRAIQELLVDLDDPGAVAKLRAKSPELRLADTGRPLLMFAGGKDPKVDVIDVKHYALALDELGKDVSFLVDDEMGHSFRVPLGLEAYLYLTERFLAYHLGGSTKTLQDPLLDSFLEENLRLVGESLEHLGFSRSGDSPDASKKSEPASGESPDVS